MRRSEQTALSRKKSRWAALSKLEVRPHWLDDLDRKVLHTIIEKFGGGPVGLETIAASISEEADTIMDGLRALFIATGLSWNRTPRGRVATPLAISTWASLSIRIKNVQPGLL